MPRPAKTDRPELKRIQMDLPPKSLDRLRRLQDVTEASSYAEVIRNALRLYEAVINERVNGGELMMKREDSIQPLHVFPG